MKLPPFGKPLFDLLKSGTIPNNEIYLFIGDHAWERGKNSQICRPTRTLILPPNGDPKDYNWPVQGCEIFLIATSEMAEAFVKDFSFLLLYHGAEVVRFSNTNFLLTIYRKGTSDE